MSNAQESVIKDLETREVELQAAIQNAARNGGDSMKFRQELKTIQGKLQIVRNDVASAQSTSRTAAARATAQAGNALAGAAVDRIMNGADPFAELLANGVSAIDFTGVPALQDAMLNVAHARARVIEAEAEHESAMSDADYLSSKASSKRERHAELLRQRTTGDAGDSSHAELYALNEDVRTLDEMRATAKAKADSLLPAVNAARTALRNAETQAAKVENRLNAEHLVAHAKALETAYLQCLRECQSIAAKAGVTLGSLHQAGHELRAYATTSVLQAPFARARA